MNFLENLVIPESNEHLTLLRYLLVLVLLFLSAYNGIALITSTVAVVLDKAGKRKSSDRFFSEFAGDLMDIAVPNKGVIFSLGVVPLITAILLYAQLLYGTNSAVATYLTYSAILYFAGFYFLYSYKKSFHLSAVYAQFRQVAMSHQAEVRTDAAAEIEEFENSIRKTRAKAGKRGVILFWIATWLFVSVIRLSFVSSLWESSFIGVIFSGNIILSFFSYLDSATVLASGAVLFFFFTWDGGMVRSRDDEYKRFVKKIVLSSGILATALEPLFIYLGAKSLPQTTISSATFGLAGIALFIAFLILYMFYSMLKDPHITLGGYVFVGALALVLIFVTTDEISFHHATMAQDQLLQARYSTMLAELNPAKAKPIISGEEIYNGRCSACHRFDVKLVGPPYNETLPHFVGKMDSLENFIMNPYLAVPGYPPMPNQGLKPEEVKAVAEYIMGVYLKSHPEAMKKDTTKTKM
jgi:cytochrome c